MAETVKNVVVPGSTIQSKAKEVFTGAIVKVQDNWKMIAMVIGALVVLTAAGFLLYQHFKPKPAPEDDDGEKTCEVLFFYTTWCPYCKKAMPIWQQFSTQWNGKTKKGYTIICTEVDCDQNEGVANKFEVTGYPTIKATMNGKVTEYDAKPDLGKLNEFLNSCFEH